MDGVVVGMITRRDLMGFNMESKLDHARQNVNAFSSVARAVVNANHLLNRDTDRRAEDLRPRNAVNDEEEFNATDAQAHIQTSPTHDQALHSHSSPAARTELFSPVEDYVIAMRRNNSETNANTINHQDRVSDVPLLEMNSDFYNT